jgi:hypothetical protein
MQPGWLDEAGTIGGLMPTYPTPEDNLACQCKGNPLAAFWCMNGHMMECHYPYDCRTAGCSHLPRYDYTWEEYEEIDQEVRAKIAAGKLPPYALDEHGNVIVKVEDVK